LWKRLRFTKGCNAIRRGRGRRRRRRRRRGGRRRRRWWWWRRRRRISKSLVLHS